MADGKGGAVPRRAMTAVCREGGKDCEARCPGCQDKCIKMLAAQLVADKERKAEKAAKRRMNDVVGMLTEDAIRRQRKKPKQK